MLKKGRAKLSRRAVQVKLKWWLYRRKKKKKKASHRTTFYFAPSFLTELPSSLQSTRRGRRRRGRGQQRNRFPSLSFPSLRLQLLSALASSLFERLFSYSSSLRPGLKSLEPHCTTKWRRVGRGEQGVRESSNTD